MLHVLHLLILTSVAKGAMSGMLAAILVDYHAFQTFKCWDDVATYNWKLASFRWFQGAVVAGAAMAGLNSVIG